MWAESVSASCTVRGVDVCVFKSYKSCLKDMISSELINTGKNEMNRKTSLKLASLAWEEGVAKRPQNIVKGFQTTGVWPLAMTKMKKIG